MKILQWFFLTMLLGNPIVALLVIVVIYWALDRYTFGFLPDPFRIFGRLRRLSVQNRRLTDNPHDRKARLDKADVLLELRRPKSAFETIRPNVEAGDHDPHTLFIAGRAAFGAGEFATGERLLEAVREEEPDFSQNRVDLELGRGRLKAGNIQGALEALERFVAARRTAIEGNVLLARARSQLGDKDGARAAREAAWTAFREAPRFLRRRERLWAYRANPLRPATYLVVAAAVGASIAYFVVPNL